LFLNNDIVLPAGTDAILAMFQHLAETPSSGAVGPVLFFPDHNVQHGGIGFFSEASYRGFCHHVDPPMPINEGHWWFARIGAVTGAFLMVRANDFFTVGCMDENYAAECQDVALCLALDRRGLSSVVAYCGDLVHLENGTRPKGEESWRDRQRFIRKWSGYIEARFL
jgi:GT2 family glycosyltransferase